MEKKRWMPPQRQVIEEPSAPAIADGQRVFEWDLTWAGMQLLYIPIKKKSFIPSKTVAIEQKAELVASTADFDVYENSASNSEAYLSVTAKEDNVLDFDAVHNRWVLSFRSLTKEEEKAGEYTAFSSYRYSFGMMLSAKWIPSANGWSFPGTVYDFTKISKMVDLVKQDRWNKRANAIFLPKSLEDMLTPLARNVLNAKRAQEERWMGLKEHIRSEFQPEDALSVTRPYFTHQKNAIEYFLSHPCVIADEMGLGKTRVSLYSAVRMFQEGRIYYAVVVCPVGVIDVWASQAKQYFPDKIKVIKVRGDFEERMRLLRLTGRGNILPLYVMGYRSTLDHPEELKKILSQGLLILDEAQAIKSPSAQVTKLLSSIPCVERRALTGTPIVNTPKDAFTIWNFIFPGLLGNSYQQFIEHFADSDGYRLHYKNLTEFNERVQSWYIRRLKKDVLKDLPPKVRILDYETIVMGEQQKKHYIEMKKHMLTEIERMTDQEYLRVGAKNIPVMIMRLLQICDGYLQATDNPVVEWIPDAGKPEVVKEILKDYVGNGKKVVIWSKFLPPLKMLATELAEYNPALLHGGVPQEKRGSNKESDISTVVGKFWHDDTCKVLLGQIHTGGQGIDLQCADLCIFYDQWWSPGVNAQAEDRLHRPGQTDTVTIITLVTEAPIERFYFRDTWEDINGNEHHGLLYQKKQWIEESIEGKGIPTPTRQELIALLQEKF